LKWSIIALMMEAVGISETPVHINVTTSQKTLKLHTRRRENLKSHTRSTAALTPTSMFMTLQNFGNL
jgi:hypothetical protein